MHIHRIAVAALLASGSAGVLGQDFIGSFKGTEKVVVSNCGSYDGTKTGPWEVTHSALDGTSYAIKGTATNSSFTGTGKFDGNASTAATNGIDKQGSRWTAKTKSSLDGDKLFGSSTGQVNGTACTFTVESEAMRVR